MKRLGEDDFWINTEDHERFLEGVNPEIIMKYAEESEEREMV